MFNVLAPHAIIKDFPHLISCLDQVQNKIFLGLEDGTLLEYEVEDQQHQFSINLLKVSKKVIKSPIKDLAILPISRSLAVLSKDGSLSLVDYSSQIIKSIIVLPRIKGAKAIARSSYSPFANDVLAVGIRRGVILFSISTHEAVESPVITLPATPTDIQFITNSSILVATQSGIYLLDSKEKSYVCVFSLMNPNTIFSSSSRRPYILAVRENDYSHSVPLPAAEITAAPRSTSNAAQGTIIYCATLGDFYEISLGSKTSSHSFSFSAATSQLAVNDYYAIGLIEQTNKIIEIRSLKTGSKLQEFPLQDAYIMKFRDLPFVTSGKCVWRLLPLDFDEQIDELLANNRFKDAEAFLNELEFATEEERRDNLVKVKGSYAQHLFSTEKKYKEAIHVLEELNASPLDVVELYPDISEMTPSGSDIPSLKELALYLARERVQLIKYIKGLGEKIYESNHGMTSFRSFTTIEQLESSHEGSKGLLEFVETCLMHVYLVIESPLLLSLVRVENSCDHAKTIALLTKYKKYEELVEFYKARGYHEEALNFLHSNRKDANDYSKIVSYLQKLDMNLHLDIVFKFAMEPFKAKDSISLTIFTENYQTINASNRLAIVVFLESVSETSCLAYLEYLVLKTQDKDPEINTRLFLIYLANSPHSAHEKTTFSSFVFSNKFYSSEKVLKSMNPEENLQEQAHILSRLHRHREALDVIVKKIGLLTMAEKYCLKHYRHNSNRANYLFSYLYEIFAAHLNPNEARRLSFIVQYGYLMIDARTCLLALSDDVKLPVLRQFLKNNTCSLQSRSNLSICKEQISSTLKFTKRYHLFNLVNKSIELDDDSMCRICLKRLSSTLCTMFPDGRLAHTYCAARIDL